MSHSHLLLHAHQPPSGPPVELYAHDDLITFFIKRDSVTFLIETEEHQLLTLACPPKYLYQFLDEHFITISCPSPDHLAPVLILFSYSSPAPCVIPFPPFPPFPSSLSSPSALLVLPSTLTPSSLTLHITTLSHLLVFSLDTQSPHSLSLLSSHPAALNPMTILTPTPHSPSSLTLTTATPTLLTHYTPSPPGFVNASGIYTPDSGMDDGDGLVRASVKIVAGAIGSVAKWGVGKLLGWPAAPSSPLQPPSDDSGCPDDSGSPAPPPPTPPLHLLPTISPPPLPPSSHILHLSASPTSPHFIVLSSPPRLLIYHLPPPLPPLTHPAPHLTGYLKLPLPPPPTTVTWLTSSTVFLGSPAGGVVVDVTTVRILQNVKFDEPVDRIIHYNGALVGANKAQSTLIYPAIHTPAPPALPSAAAQEFRQLLTLSPTSPDSVARLIRTIETSCVDLQSCLMFLNILPKIESDEIALKVIDAVAQTLPTLQATVSTETAEKVEKLLKHAETQRTVWRLICETTGETLRASNPVFTAQNDLLRTTGSYRCSAPIPPPLFTHSYLPPSFTHSCGGCPTPIPPSPPFVHKLF